MLATQYAENYKMEPQREGENDYDFRYRVAGKKRKNKKSAVKTDTLTSKPENKSLAFRPCSANNPLVSGDGDRQIMNRTKIKNLVKL